MELQLHHYRQSYDSRTHDIILWNKKPIGRLYIGYDTDQIVLMDITLISTYRNKGIGSLFLHKLIEESRHTNRPIRLHVFQLNEKARKFYERLGFRKIEEQGPHIYMECIPLSTG
jgi:ribosomal protein S18 acetylase RimI-like enzyme